MKKALLLTVFSLCIVTFSACLVNRFFSCSRLSCLTLNNLSQFKSKEIYQENKNIFSGLLSYKKDLLRVEVRYRIKQIEAEQHINAQIINMKGLFAKATSPYPGEISDEIDCQEKFKPTFTKIKTASGVKIAYFTGYLNQRLVFGACTEDQMFYKGVLALFYCPKQKQLFQNRNHRPKKRF
jgi:hypothetical protein